MVFSAFFYLAFGHIDGYDMKDALFGGLGLSLGNYSLVAYQHDKKFVVIRERIIVESAVLACVFCLFLGIVFAAECIGNASVYFYWIDVVMYVLVICSLVLCYSTNRAALNLIIEKR